MREWKVFLSGEIHSDWRDQIIHAAEEMELPIEFLLPQTAHEISDQCGAVILGEEVSDFWLDHKSAKLNAIRQNPLLEECDIIVVRFGENYKQWNAAFEAGLAVAKGKSLLVLSEPQHNHALKEIHASALAVANQPMQIVNILKYVTEGHIF